MASPVRAGVIAAIYRDWPPAPPRYSAGAILCVMARRRLPRRPGGGQSGRPLLAYRCQRRPPAADRRPPTDR